MPDGCRKSRLGSPAADRGGECCSAGHRDHGGRRWIDVLLRVRERAEPRVAAGRLGWVAPLVAPAVDLSVVALLVATRHLATRGAAPEVLKPARQLLMFSSVVTVALNVADPLIAGEWGKAAFDAVGPLLLIGWAHVGPDLLLVLGWCPTSPREEGGLVLVETGEDNEARSDELALEPTVGAGETECEGPGDLLAWARAVDAKHRALHQRPVSAETLRKELHVGAHRARALVDEVRREHLEKSAA
jgi:hypothetical protein